jgi:hypothetical protein
MNAVYPFQISPSCKAIQSGPRPCQAPALNGWTFPLPRRAMQWEAQWRVPAPRPHEGSDGTATADLRSSTGVAALLSRFCSLPVLARG